MTGIYPDNYTLPTTTFNENCVFSATGSNTTSIGGLGTGALILGANSKETQVAGTLLKTGTVDRLLAIRSSSNQSLGTVNQDFTLIWNQVLEQVGSISLNTTTGVITIPRAGFYNLCVGVNLQAAVTNSYSAIGYNSAATTTSSSYVATNCQTGSGRPAFLSFSEIVYFSSATTLSITGRSTTVSSFLSQLTTGNIATNRLSITHLF